ncbi:MAG: hypothetical protein GX557_07505 [Chloroflexi bacterium]|nr:hypothetical protein [Chloroflexota bacterium]
MPRRLVRERSAPQPPSASLGRPGARELLLVVGGYMLLTIAATWPLARNLNSALLGSGDGLQNIWNLWWARQALQRGHLDLYHTFMLYHPDGVSLAYHTLVPLNCLAAYPLLLLGIDVRVVFNSFALATSVCSGLTLYLLLRHHSQDRLAAFLAGSVWLFSPIRLSRLMYGNVQIYSTQFIPIMVYCLERARRGTGWGYWLGAGMALGLTAWCGLELALGTALLAGLLLVFDLCRSGVTWRRVGRWAAVVVVTVGVALPVVWPLLSDAALFPAERDTLASSERNSADLLGLFVPDTATDPLVGRLAPAPLARAIAFVQRVSYGNPHEKSVFLGYSVLAVALAALLGVRRREVCEWTIVAIVFALLALGPRLYIGGQPSLPMPFRLLNALPFLGSGRSPSRMVLFTMLALSVVCAHGLAALRARRPRLQWLAVLLGLCFFLEFYAAPVPLDRRAYEVSAHSLFLRDDARAGAVLDVPLDLFGAEGPASQYMLEQMTHGRPIAGGYVSRTPEGVMWPLERPFLSQLHARLYGDTTPHLFDAEVLAGARDELAALDVRFVVLHTRYLDEGDAALMRDVLTGLLAAPVYEDGQACIWALD